MTTVERRATHLKEAVANYKEHDIYLDENMTFCAVGPLMDDLASPYGRGSASLLQAKEAIDEAFRMKTKEAKTAEALSLGVLTEDGKEVKIRGVHSGTGDILFTPPQKNSHSVYAPAPWVMQYLLEMKQLQRQLDVIKKELNRARIGFRSYGRIPPHRYDEKIDELKESYTEAVAEAAKPPKD
jgi:hypothetical protein